MTCQKKLGETQADGALNNGAEASVEGPELEEEEGGEE